MRAPRTPMYFHSSTEKTTMNSAEQRALLNIMVHAALADGQKAESEREVIRSLVDSFPDSGDGRVLASAYQDVLLKRVSMPQAAGQLKSLEHRQLAYEMAVCVCDADGLQSPAERDMLGNLRSLLSLESDAPTQQAEAQINSMAEAAYGTQSSAAPAAALPVVVANAAPATAVNNAELDKMILNYAILNGALELLPQSWATMAIVPLQVKMVYRVGKAHGVELDQGHIKDFIAAAGIGLSSQYLEQFGRKLLGGLLGKVGGRTLGGVGSAATGMAFSFASTYALGQLSRRYYAGGRVMNVDVLRQTYNEMLQPAKSLQQQYLPAMQEKARTLDMGQVMAMVKG
jgi:uncharacterized protein (DUF697 family)/tellurite resistance protein